MIDWSPIELPDDALPQAKRVSRQKKGLQGAGAAFAHVLTIHIPIGRLEQHLIVSMGS
jgi:hypothetical protein